MRFPLLSIGLALVSAATLRADMVLVQKMEGAGQSGEMTIKIKGDKMRVDITPQVSTIIDTASGATTTLMHPQKICMAMDGAATKALLENARKQGKLSQTAGTAAGASTVPVLQPTGKHEAVNGVDTEIFTVEIGALKSTYWIAKDYPNAAKLLEMLKKMQSSSLSAMAREMAPQPTSFPGVPIKTEVEIAPGQKVTSTLISAKEEPLADTEFTVPADYKALPAPSFGTPGASGGN